MKLKCSVETRGPVTVLASPTDRDWVHEWWVIFLYPSEPVVLAVLPFPKAFLSTALLTATATVSYDKQQSNPEKERQTSSEHTWACPKPWQHENISKSQEFRITFELLTKMVMKLFFQALWECNKPAQGQADLAFTVQDNYPSGETSGSFFAIMSPAMLQQWTPLTVMILALKPHCPQEELCSELQGAFQHTPLQLCHCLKQRQLLFRVWKHQSLLSP